MSPRAADRQLDAWLRLLGPAAEPDVATLRAESIERLRQRPRGAEMAHVADQDADGVPVRRYVPSGACPPAPVLVYLHGGGWTIGSVDTHDNLCRALAAGAGVRVVSVDYRLAPEHPWPAQVDDCVTALRWVARGGAEGARAGRIGVADGDGPAALRVGVADGDEPAALRVGVAGDSAGGTLAALTCLRLRDEAPEAQPVAQILLCPNVDLAGDSESMRDKARGWGLDADLVRWFAARWLADRVAPEDPRVSPLRAPDLSGLPPAVVVTAEHDVLRDEGAAYARALAAAGVPAEHRCEPGLVHGFAGLADVSPACAAGLGRVIDDVRRLLHA